MLGHGGYGGGQGLGVGLGEGRSGGPPRLQFPELYQGIPAQFPAGVSSQTLPTEASSFSKPPEPVQVSQQFEKATIHQESPSSQAIQPVPPLSKLMRFPLRPCKSKIDGLGFSGALSVNYSR